MYSTTGMSRMLQARLNGDSASRNFNYAQEFRCKVAFDYRIYILLSPKMEIGLHHILNYAVALRGFEAYRLVYKGEKIIHIYMRYQSARLARMAIGEFKALFGDLVHVTSVSAMLEAMYTLENVDRTFPTWTPTLIDTVGVVQEDNLMDRERFAAMIFRFGNPRLYDFRFVNERGVLSAQALFPSMAEALGASIVLGQWVDYLYQHFPYRIRIVGGEKEIDIFKRLMIYEASSVFDLEYFVGGEIALCAPPAPPQLIVNEPTSEVIYQQIGNQNSYPPMKPIELRMTEMTPEIFYQQNVHQNISPPIKPPHEIVNEQTPEVSYQQNVHQNSYPPMKPPQEIVNEQTPEVYQRNVHQNSQLPMNPPAQRGTQRHRGRRYLPPRRHINNNTNTRQTLAQIQQQGTQVPGS